MRIYFDVVAIFTEEGGESARAEIVRERASCWYRYSISKPEIDGCRIVWAWSGILGRWVSGLRFRFDFKPAVVDGPMYFSIA